ncbi:AzlD domain-containing protein [Lacticaseibacillus chiayiensis]|uniref:AzlD domain-containing protein n=1 Tax=Lacticaseibacillus chiayiensis TaxID=2100821 RepID=UPI001013197A|nr:AzlD domain-containing protein [Lacticaseibacillus chiayiensis]RXT58077.1 branched-chain amino acid ABC transporter [Lacticaseibacillus chiayiensis]
MQNPDTLIAILSCGLATWLLRVVPIVLVKRMTIPAWLLHFLNFVPVAILSAIFVENLLVIYVGHWPSVNWPNLFASLPAIGIAIITKSLFAVVVAGVASMAVLRLLGWA